MRRWLIAMLATLLGIGAVAAPVSAAPPMLPGMDRMQEQMDQDVAELRGLTGRDFEIAFMEKMIPHHESAVMMAQLVPTRATHPELKTLAQDIIASQQQEIAQMRGWLKDWYGIANPTLTPMAGMEMMRPAMERLTGAEFEQVFLMMMPMHHIGASNMSALAPGRATHPELLRLAQTIVTSQGQEIEQMRGWAMTWYDFDPMALNHGGMPMPGLPNTGGGAAARQAADFPLAALALLATLAALPAGIRIRRWARGTH